MKNKEEHIIDAQGESFGRIAVKISRILQGKHKPKYQRFLDSGDRVVVRGVSKIKFTGKKLDQKKYHRYSGYPGGIKTLNLRDRFEKDPEELLKSSVYQMLPDNKLRKNIIKRLTFEN